MPDDVAAATVAILLCKNKPHPHLLPPHRHSQRNIRRTRAKKAKPDWVCPMLFCLSRSQRLHQRAEGVAQTFDKGECSFGV